MSDESSYIFNLSPTEKKGLAEQLYKEEEDKWTNVTKAYYLPKNAPGRLPEELLEQHHRTNNTGIKHPQDLKRTLVKVIFDKQSFSIKHFLSEFSAKEYIKNVRHYGVETEIIAEENLSTMFRGVLK